MPAGWHPLKQQHMEKNTKSSSFGIVKLMEEMLGRDFWDDVHF